MGEWPRLAFADLIRAGVLEIGDGYRAKNEELGGDGPIFLRAGLVQDSGIDLTEGERFRADRVPALVGKTSRAGDVLVTTKGNSTGRVAFVDERMPEVVYSPHLSYWRSLDPNRLLPGYLRYWSRSRDFLSQLAAMATSTDMAPYLSLTDQRRLTLPIPPPHEQRRIAGILGALDDKVELNRRIVETLEELVRTDYSQWARRSAGELPHGWHIGSIDELATNPRELVEPERVGDATPYVGLEHVPRGRLVIDRWGTADAAESQKAVFHRGDVLFGKLRPYFRKVGAAPVDGICSTDILVLRPRAPTDFGQLLGIATDPAFIEHANAASTGTRMPRASWADMTRYSIAIPPPVERAVFTERVMPLVERAFAAGVERRMLASVRDLLLPRLLSDELPATAPSTTPQQRSEAFV